MKLTVLSVAYPLTPVGPDAVGGSEQILTLLDAALTNAGHRSLVVACEGSVAQGTLIQTPKWDGPLTDEIRTWGQQQHRIAIEQALKDWPVDLIHMHSLDFHRYLPSGRVPLLATLHLPPDWYPPEVYNLRRPNTWIQGVSADQTGKFPTSRNLLPHIDNGVDIGRLARPLRKRDFAVALGRICPEKGLHYALDAALKERVPLLLGGEVFKYEAHEEYFRTEIQPRLSDTRRFLGPLGFRQKRRVLSQARCMMIPSLVAETSSLVAMEAISCGTPVIAFSSGALPEIVDEGKTGFIVEDENRMARALRAIRYIDPEVCRETARERFSAGRMTGRYIQRYCDLVMRGEHTAAAATEGAEAHAR